jgi:gamma-glutamyltranspeptidase/glutathione hydrolase
VGGWQALSERFGRLGLDACLADAVDVAERGYAVAGRTAEAWASASEPTDMWPPTRVPPELVPAPGRGQIVRHPELAATLRAIARDGAPAFYAGAVAEAICAASWLEASDLAAYSPRWVEPLTTRYRDYVVAELPPPTQGIAALEGLALLEGMSPDLPNQVDCMRLALEDARANVRDGADVTGLLADDYLAQRRRDVAAHAAEPAGGTVYLCAVDEDRMAVSFIQSLFGRFGSGLTAPGTGVVLQNRGACFELQGGVVPGERPYHTIIPGMLLRDGALAGPFGVMGGLIQAQAHLQLVSALVDDGLDPQAALDRARFRVEGDSVRLEEGLWDREEELTAHGHRVVLDPEVGGFGGGQAIVLEGEALIGGSDARKDGYAGGL